MNEVFTLVLNKVRRTRTTVPRLGTPARNVMKHLSYQCAKKIVLSSKQNDMAVQMNWLIILFMVRFLKWQNFHFTQTIGIQNSSWTNQSPPNPEIKQHAGGLSRTSVHRVPEVQTGELSEIQTYSSDVHKIFSSVNQWQSNPWSALQKILTRNSTGLKIKIFENF